MRDRSEWWPVLVIEGLNVLLLATILAGLVMALSQGRC